MVVCIQWRQILYIDCHLFWNESSLHDYELKCHRAPTMAKFRCIQLLYFTKVADQMYHLTKQHSYYTFSFILQKKRDKNGACGESADKRSDRHASSSVRRLPYLSARTYYYVPSTDKHVNLRIVMPMRRTCAAQAAAYLY